MYVLDIFSSNNSYSLVLFNDPQEKALGDSDSSFFL